MNAPLVTENLHKSFGAHAALQSLSFSLPPGRVAGLLGRNGSGKSTLINLACGLLVPTSGSCTTLGRPILELDAPELSRLGVVFQEGRFLDWMSVGRQLAFHASFYPVWDKAREGRLLKELELDPTRKIGQLSPGDRQKLGIILGVCHHPTLLLLDEPISALDPIARTRMLAFLIDLIREDESTVLVSSHILSDIEKVVDWVICLDRGRLTTSADLDTLRESHSEWIVTSPTGSLPARFSEAWIRSRLGDAYRARLTVHEPGEAAAQAFLAVHRATLERRPLNLEQLFPLLIEIPKAAA